MRTTVSVLTTACVVAALGCGDSSGPGSGPDKQPITITFCPDVGPTWFAHQDEGGRWTRVAIVNDVASFEGTEKQAVAMAYAAGFGSSVSVIYTTATTLGKLGCEDDFTFGTKTVTGTAAHLAGNHAFINIGAASGFAGFEGDSTFSVFGVANGARDLFATSRANFDVAPDKMIIRRATTYANNESIALDFDGAEAFALETHALSATGVGSTPLYVTHDFHSATANHDLLFSSGAASILTVPSAKLVSGDYHQTTANVMDASGIRGVVLKYKDGGAKTLPFGPAPTTPAFATASTSPFRLRATLAAPPEYALGASIFFEQSDRTFDVSVLKDHLGALPATWTIEIPDLRGADGFATAWQLTNASYDWSAQLLDGPIELLSGVAPLDDAMVRFAVTGSFGGCCSPAAPAPGAGLGGAARIIRPPFLAGRR